jgi:branched-chain amino acid transport system substrate-binding protein
VKNRLHRIIGAIAVAALVAGPLAPGPARAASAPYEIDAILSLTGPFAFLGNTEAASLRTLEVLINKGGGINGQPVAFTISDDQSQPAVAVQLANAIIAKHPAVMLGPTYVASCLAVAPLVRANGPVQYCFAPTIHPPAGSFTFSGGASSSDQAIETLVFAKGHGWKKLAYIATTDATGQDIEGQFKEAIKLPKFDGMSFVAGEHYNGSDVSIAAQLANIKAANPDAILGMTVGTATGTLFRSIRDAGLDSVPLLSNLGNLLNTALAQYSSFMPQKVYFTAPRFYAHDVSGKGPVRDAQTAFYKAFNANGIDPDVGNGFPWDPTRIIIAGLRKLGPQADAKSLLAYMEAVHDFAGINGIADYRGGDQRGQGLTALVIVQWNAAKKHVVTVSEPGGIPLK